MGAAHVGGPHRAGQAVVGVVGPGQGLLLGVELGDRDHRAEHLATDDFVVLAGAGEHGRLDEEARTVGGLAAGDHLDVRHGLGAFEEAQHAVAVGSGDQRAELDAILVLGAQLERADGLAELGDELLVHAFLCIDAAGGSAVLPGVVEAEGTDAFHGGVDVGVVEDQHRGLAAQFHVGAFHGFGGAGDDVDAGGDGAGQRDHAHLGMGDQRLADARAAAEHQVDHPGGEDRRDQLGQFQRGQRGLLGGLEHHAVAGGQGRGQLPGGHHQRVVPGRDGGDHADRVAADHRGVPRQVLAGGRARHAAHRAGEEAEHVGDRRQLVAQGGSVGLAAVLRFQAGQGFGMGVDGVGHLQQQRRALARGGLRPVGEGGIGRLHGSIDLGRAGLGDLHQGGPQRRIEDRLDSTFTSHQLAVDQQFGLHRISLVVAVVC